MAIRLEDTYTEATVADANYPGGSFRNDSTGFAGDGTPVDEVWANDKEGFFQGLLARASIVPSGAPDTVPVSQYMAALDALFAAIGHSHSDVLQSTDINIAGNEITSLTLPSYPTSYGSLWDLSPYIPEGCRYAIVAVEMRQNTPDGGTDTANTRVYMRPDGTSGTGQVVGACRSAGSGDDAGTLNQATVRVGANGKVGYYISNPPTFNPTSATIIFRLQGWIM